MLKQILRFSCETAQYLVSGFRHRPKNSYGKASFSLLRFFWMGKRNERYGKTERKDDIVPEVRREQHTRLQEFPDTALPKSH